jgi:hypothetical protein
LFSIDHKVETSSEVNKIKVDKDSLRKLKIKLQNTREEKLSSNLRLYKLRKEYKLLKTKHEISDLTTCFYFMINLITRNSVSVRDKFYLGRLVGFIYIFIPSLSFIF